MSDFMPLLGASRHCRPESHLGLLTGGRSLPCSWLLIPPASTRRERRLPKGRLERLCRRKGNLLSERSKLLGLLGQRC